MAITKANTSLLSAVVTTQTSSAVSTTGDYADAVYVSAVVTGSPAAAATFAINQSPDGSTYYSQATYTVSTTNGTYNWIIALDPTCEKVTVTFTAGTAGDCSFTAQLGQVTAV